MGFLGVCTAIYDYQPQGDNELEISEGDLVRVLEKGDDGWWKAKKNPLNEEDDEPQGLVPENYLEPAKPSHQAKAIYTYDRQTEEEMSFPEDAVLDVYDISDPDWILVGLNEEFGFAPANYIELQEETAPASTGSRPPPPRAPEPEPKAETPPATSPIEAQGPAASLARVLGGRAPSLPQSSSVKELPRPPSSEPEEEAPKLPQRPPSQSVSPPAQVATPRIQEPPRAVASPPHNRVAFREGSGEDALRSPGGYHLYNINEMVSAMGKRKKMPTTLGLNVATGTIMFSPENARDGASQQWTADRMTHYSIEGKHVFIELIRPTKSLDLHAGTKDTAEEIVAMLGEIAGAVRGEGIREVMAAATGAGGQKKGQMLYEFEAQQDDEVTVAVGDEVIILNDEKSDEWWMIRRLKNGKEGVVPCSYVEVTGTLAAEPPSRSGINAGLSNVEQNRLEEERLAKEAARRKIPNPDLSGVAQPVIKTPDRGSSLTREETRRERRSKSIDGKTPKTKPDVSRCRVWTDRSGSFKVEAQFIGLADGKIHLHKVNGVKIAVPVAKMAAEDLAYVEKATGVSLDEDKPLNDIKRQKSKVGASVEHPKRPQYDWFDFFLKAGVGPHQCERYAQSMNRDSMDETNLPDITSSVLRTLGFKEGDILRVMKYLDSMHGRSRSANSDGEAPGSSGGLFSNADGGLRNNTRKGRPETSRVASDVVDARAFEQSVKSPSAEAVATPLTSAPARERQNGFEDNAWDVKAPAAAQEPASAAVVAPPKPALNDDLAGLSLSNPPLQPAMASPPPQPTPQQPAPPVTTTTSPPPQPQPGANPAFFGQLLPQQTGVPQSQYPTGQQALPRQRPQAPQAPLNAPGLLPPPPRPLSAPQNFPQQNQFGPPPLQPQLTGIPQSSALQAPPGQSLNDINQQRLQAQYTQQQAQLAPQMTAYQQPFQTGLVPQPTAFQPQAGYLNGTSPAPFQPQQTGFSTNPSLFNPARQPSTGGINSVLPPALQPTPTGYQSQIQQPQNQYPPVPPLPLSQHPTGFQTSIPTNGFPPTQSPFQAPPPPMPPIPSHLQHQISSPVAAPLVAQKTGPAPPVRFGVENADANRLVGQATGRRANLGKATAQNPFGF